MQGKWRAQQASAHARRACVWQLLACTRARLTLLCKHACMHACMQSHVHACMYEGSFSAPPVAHHHHWQTVLGIGANSPARLRRHLLFLQGASSLAATPSSPPNQQAKDGRQLQYARSAQHTEPVPPGERRQRWVSACLPASTTALLLARNSQQPNLHHQARIRS